MMQECIITKDDVKISEEDLITTKKAVDFFTKKCMFWSIALPMGIFVSIIMNTEWVSYISVFGSNTVALIGLWGLFGIDCLMHFIVYISLQRGCMTLVYYKELLNLPDTIKKYVYVICVITLLFFGWLIYASFETVIEFTIFIAAAVSILVGVVLFYLNNLKIKNIEKVVSDAIGNGLISQTKSIITIKANDIAMSTDKPIEKVWKCDECGTENPNTSDYCKNCGQYK